MPRRIVPYLLLLPAFVTTGAIVLYPTIYTLCLSLFRFNPTSQSKAMTFVGVGNYVRLLAGGEFWHSAWVTLLYTAGAVVISFSLGLLAALMLNEQFPGRTVARALIFLPWAIPWIVATVSWYCFLSPNIGPINVGLRTLGIIEAGIPWLYQRSTALGSVIISTTWKLFPVATLLILAGLQGIPKELYDAASVDGAGPLQRFVFVTVPSLAPVNSVVVVLLTMWSFKLFTVVYALTKGGPGTATMVLSVYTYDQAFTLYRFGDAAALASLVLVMNLCLVLMLRRLSQRG